LIKRFVHWLIAVAVVLHLFSCIFLGQSFMPGVGF
jgi:Ni,Fe-hydrogenase I cytochrome b subunit